MQIKLVNGILTPAATTTLTIIKVDRKHLINAYPFLVAHWQRSLVDWNSVDTGRVFHKYNWVVPNCLKRRSLLVLEFENVFYKRHFDMFYEEESLSLLLLSTIVTVWSWFEFIAGWLAGLQTLIVLFVNLKRKFCSATGACRKSFNTHINVGQH